MGNRTQALSVVTLVEGVEVTHGFYRACTDADSEGRRVFGQELVSAWCTLAAQLERHDLFSGAKCSP
jgi:hypothetical protein